MKIYILPTLFAAFISILGCTSREVRVPIFANGHAVDDALHAGEQLFLLETWNTEILDEWPPAEFMLQLLENEPEFFGDQFQNFGFIPDPSRDFPIGLARGARDPQRLHETCALCHVARLPDDKLWIGAPNLNLDFGRFRSEINQRWSDAGNDPLLSALEVEKLRELGPGRFGAESKAYPRAIPADFPPYFELGARTHMNYLGTGQNLRTEVHFALFAFGAGAPNAQTARVRFPAEDRVSELVAFMSNLSAPLAPPQDPAFVARGAEIFIEARCDGCHHPHDPGLDGVTTIDTATDGIERYPGDDEAYPRGSIRTSPAHRILQDGDPNGEGEGMDEVLLADYLQLIFDHDLAVRPTDGYRVSPLIALWATAPYLHNGSVPTLMDLLTPAVDRPKRWRRGEFEIDTTRFGNSNVGHEYGTHLAVDERSALVAYLLSL